MTALATGRSGPHHSPWATDDIVAFRGEFRRFLEKELAPQAAGWRERKMVDRAAWRRLGEMGALLTSVPEAYGGLGGSYAHEAAVIEEIETVVPELTVGVCVHSPIVSHYILNYGSEEQKLRWLPTLASGETIGAIALTEPGGGSDLQAVKTTAKLRGNAYAINGAKTFITNGQLADLIIVAAKTDSSEGARGISLFLLETSDADGFKRGRNLDKIGLHASDTSELFFDDVLVPPENLLGGEEGRGFYQMMEQLPQERLTLAVSAVAAMERALALTIAYVKERRAFGKAVAEFQNTAFTLAELKTEVTVARTFLDRCVTDLIEGRLDGSTASMAKWWCSQKQVETIDACLQLHGGYGYMAEYPIARMYVDARVQKIYGGTNEIMKMLIARNL